MKIRFKNWEESFGRIILVLLGYVKDYDIDYIFLVYGVSCRNNKDLIFFFKFKWNNNIKWLLKKYFFIFFFYSYGGKIVVFLFVV